MSSSAPAGKPLQVIVQPCGTGKTRDAAEVALEQVQRRPVVYIAPTMALLQQFERILKERRPNTKVKYAVGRRLHENCTEPPAFVRPLFGITPESYCSECPVRSSCVYIASREEINSPSPGVVYLTTYSFVVHNVYRTAWRSSVLAIYDEMPSALWETKMPDTIRNVGKWIRVGNTGELYREIVNAAELRIPPAYRRHRKEIAARMAPSYVFIPSFPMGEETMLLTATPIPVLIRAMFPDAAEVEIDETVALMQTVRVNYAFLPHSADWQPDPQACGFKKNTQPGLPYFRASMGLGSWRGVPLRVAGTDSPPPYVFVLLATLVGAKRFLFSKVVCKFDGKFFHPLVGRKTDRIESAVLSVEIERGDRSEIVPFPYEAVVSDLIQLLGRSGVLENGKENVVYTTQLLRFENTHFSRGYVQELVPGIFDARALLRDAASHFVAGGFRDPYNWLIAFYPMAAGQVGEFAKLADMFRRRLDNLNALLAQAKAAVRGGGGGQANEEENELPF